jgi:hypothetical protein
MSRRPSTGARTRRILSCTFAHNEGAPVFLPYSPPHLVGRSDAARGVRVGRLTKVVSSPEKSLGPLSADPDR